MLKQRIFSLDYHKYEKDDHIRDRIKAVLLYDKGWSYQKIAEGACCDPAKVLKIVMPTFCQIFRFAISNRYKSPHHPLKTYN